MTNPLRVYNPFSPSEVTYEYAPTGAAELNALLRTTFTPATPAQLRAFVQSVTMEPLADVLHESFAWPRDYAGEELARIRTVLNWHLSTVQPNGFPLGTGTVVVSETDPLAALTHLVVALFTGNRVVLATTPQAARFATVVAEHAVAAEVPVHAAYWAPETLPEHLAHPMQAFATWWGDSFTGFELVRELTELAPGQLRPRRLWGQLDGNGVALICEDADVQRTAARVARFAFTPVATTSLGIERVVVAEAVHDEFVTALIAAADQWRGFVAPTSALSERFTQFRQLAHLEGRVVRDADDGVIATDVPVSASIACEVVRGPLVAVQRAATPEGLLELASGGLYGSIAAVFGGDAEFVGKVAAANIAGTIFHNELRHPAPHESAPVAKLSGFQAFPLGPELYRNYERDSAQLPHQ